MENFASVEDKRRHRRVDYSAPVQYRNLRVAAELPAGSITRNIGEGGVCFRTSKFISLACRLVVEVSLPNSPKPIKAISKVAWIRKVPSSDQYEMGNQFLEIAKEDKAHILNFVNQVLNPAITSPIENPAPANPVVDPIVANPIPPETA